MNDPYNPYTRTEKFQNHMRRQKKLEALQHRPQQRQLAQSRSVGTLHGSMRPMEGNSLSMLGDTNKSKGAFKESEGAQ